MEDRLQKFVVLADTESFTRAAEQLRISQPALTVAIKKLERELHAQLLVSEGRGFRLTSAGKLAYMEGRELVARRKNLSLQLAALQHQKSPLAIGMIDSIAEALLGTTNALERLERASEVSLSVNSSSALLQAVTLGQLDVVILVEQLHGLSSRFEQVNIGTEPLVFVAAAHQKAKVEAELAEGRISRFLSYNQLSTTYQLVQTAASRAGVTLEPSFYSTSPGIILKQTLSRKGVAALPYLLVKEHLRDGVLVPIVIGESCIVGRAIVSLKQRRRLVSRATDDTLDQIRIMLAAQMKAAAKLDPVEALH